MRGDLRRLKRDAGSGKVIVPAEAAGSGTRALSSGAVVLSEARRHKALTGVLAALTLAVLAAAAFGIYGFVTDAPPPGPRPGSRMTLTRLTTSGDAQGCGAITPDGKYVAYCTFAGELRVMQVATGSTVVLGNYRGATIFSPDGDYLFVQSTTDEHPTGVLWMMPTIGGPARRVVTNIVGAPAISPDGRRIAFLRRMVDERAMIVMLADADGSNERRLLATTEEAWLDYPGLAWSPDGKLLSASQGTTVGGFQMRPAVVHLERGTVETVGTRTWPSVGRTAWLPGNVLLFSAPERADGPDQFWTVKYPDGEAIRVTTDARGFGNISVSPTADGSAIATIPVDLVSTLWETNADGTMAPVQWTSGTRKDGEDDIRPLPDGRVLYRSWDGTEDSIWIADRAGATPRKLTRMPTSSPAVPADGRFVVFAGRHEGRSRIWRMEPDGSGARMLTSGDEDSDPVVSPDGKWVYFAVPLGCMRVPADGGEASRVHDLAYPLDISPDGRQLLALLPDAAGALSLVTMDPDTGAVLTRLKVPGDIETARWGREPGVLTFIASRDNVGNLWEQRIDGGPARQLTRFTEGEIFGFGYSADRTRLFLGRGKRTGDVYLIRDFQ